MNTHIRSNYGQTDSVPQYLTRAQLAQKLQKTERAIDKWRKAGLLPYVKLGSSVLFDPAAVSTALAKLTVNASSGSN